MNIDKYLYEIIDDYKNADTEEEKMEIVKDFLSSIWGSKNKRRTYPKTIKFSVKSDLSESDVGQIFNSWSEVEYISYKSITKETDWCSLLRQKINNLYTRYFDKDVILNKEYMELLRTPRKLYYRYIGGENIEVEELKNIINDSINRASELKIVCQKQKMDLSWEEYKNVINEFLSGIIHRCKPIEDYENENHVSTSNTNKYIYDFYNEDKSYIKYVCDSLEGEMLKWQKKYYGVREHQQYKRCKECGKLIEIKSKKDHSTKYCADCKHKKDLEKYKRYNDKRSRKNLPPR